MWFVIAADEYPCGTNILKVFNVKNCLERNVFVKVQKLPPSAINLVLHFSLEYVKTPLEIKSVSLRIFSISLFFCSWKQ